MTFCRFAMGWIFTTNVYAEQETPTIANVLLAEVFLSVKGGSPLYICYSLGSGLSSTSAKYSPKSSTSIGLTSMSPKPNGKNE